MSSFVLSKHLLLCFLEGIALAEIVAYVIEDDSDGPFYTKDLAELYKTRLKELGGIDYISLSRLDLQMLVLQLFHMAVFPCDLLSSKLQSFKFSITNIPR